MLLQDNDCVNWENDIITDNTYYKDCIILDPEVLDNYYTENDSYILMFIKNISGSSKYISGKDDLTIEISNNESYISILMQKETDDEDPNEYYVDTFGRFHNTSDTVFSIN